MNNNRTKHRRSYILSEIMSYICLLLPYLIIMLVNKDTYFTEKNKLSMSLGCVACIIVAFIVCCKKIHLLKGLGGFIAIIVISFLMDVVLEDLTIIGIFGAVGYIFYLVFQSVAKKEKVYLKAYINKEVSEE